MFALETHAGYLSQYSQEPVKHWIFTVSLDKTEEVHKRCTTQLKDLTEKEGQEQSRTVCRFEHCRMWDPICVTFDFILHGIPVSPWKCELFQVCIPAAEQFGQHYDEEHVGSLYWCLGIELTHRFLLYVSFLFFWFLKPFSPFWIDPFHSPSKWFRYVLVISNSWGWNLCFQPFTSKQPNPLGVQSPRELCLFLLDLSSNACTSSWDIARLLSRKEFCGQGVLAFFFFGYYIAYWDTHQIGGAISQISR